MDARTLMMSCDDSTLRLPTLRPVWVFFYSVRLRASLLCSRQLWDITAVPPLD
jgi:hypothetical protein